MIDDGMLPKNREYGLTWIGDGAGYWSVWPLPSSVYPALTEDDPAEVVRLTSLDAERVRLLERALDLVRQGHEAGALEVLRKAAS